MRPEDLVGALLGGALGKRGRRSRGALKYLAGGKGSFLTAGTLLTAAGLAWGAYEAATRKPDDPAAPPVPGPLPGGGAARPPSPSGTSVVPPPLPGAGAGAAAASPAVSAPGLPADVLRLMRLTIAAARVDGRLTDEELKAILGQARAAGAEAVVQQEMQSPRPLAEIVAGVADRDMKEQLYVLGFAVVRSDETISGAERIFLAQLAHALGLDPAATARLESEAGARIEAASREV